MWTLVITLDSPVIQDTLPFYESAFSAVDAGDLGSILEARRSPGGRNGNLLQCYCQENPMDRGAWRAIVHMVAKSQTRLSTYPHTHPSIQLIVVPFASPRPRVCCAQSFQSCPTLCKPMDCSLPGSSVHRDSPGENTGVGCHALLKGIFLTQRSNPYLLCLLH